MKVYPYFNYRTGLFG